ncbi:MAG: VaFE repeat-containing surface-anchored protein, partial [Ilumatobacteraceae bacterium]
IVVPPDAPLLGRTVVVYQRLEVASSDRVVAEHADPDAEAQTIRFPAVTTRLRAVEAPHGQPAQVGDRLVDVVTYAALEPGRRYRLEMTLHLRSADGICTPTDQDASVDIEPTSATGTIEVPGARLPGDGTYVAFERIVALDPEATPADTVSDPDGTTGDATHETGAATVIARHEDCDDAAQTIRSFAPSEATTTTTTAPPAPSTTAPPTTTAPPRPLPRTGGSHDTTLTGALALLLMGVGLVIATKRTRA